MSSWTYVHGTIVVSPLGRTQHEKRYILETVLDHLPVVTGSERDMEVYVIQKRGHNCSSFSDEFTHVVYDSSAFSYSMILSLLVHNQRKNLQLGVYNAESRVLVTPEKNYV